MTGKIGTDKVFDPKSGQVFVFGSNLAGIHGAGAALFARERLGALQRVGEGPMPIRDRPSCYALPTKDENLETLSLAKLDHHVQVFCDYAATRTNLTFFVTRVGCGLAGLTDKEMGPLFNNAPFNCILPYGWGWLHDHD